ncbi:hypothetical protein [Xylophilus ampelinus]|uniref:hypothetical protein n=1 Tax=Xylophilus ampelinus TaxID=54067 RepID=UPI000D7CFD5F|nr:hypothetical protein [Xylophilus ampelinus]MCS4509689.1 hypothetical protein [Xylophilus ampelinus]
MFLTACDRPGAGHSAVGFPDDAAIGQALKADFDGNPDNASARELVATLGGAKGRLDYRVQRVVYRQGAFEAQYDVSLHLSRSGTDSLQQLYGNMIPKDVREKLSEQTLAAYETWLAGQAATDDKSDAAPAAALRRSLATLNECYKSAKAGDDVLLMQGLAALISPARDGWYAEKLESPRLRLRCLPL